MRSNPFNQSQGNNPVKQPFQQDTSSSSFRFMSKECSGHELTGLQL